MLSNNNKINVLFSIADQGGQILGFNCSIPEITQKVTYPENSKG